MQLCVSVFQVGLERVATEHTRLIFMTTGVLLQKMVSAKCLTEYSHIFLDEVVTFNLIFNIHVHLCLPYDRVVAVKMKHLHMNISFISTTPLLGAIQQLSFILPTADFQQSCLKY